MSLINIAQKVNMIDRLKDDINDTANNDVHYYAAYSGITPWENEGFPPSETSDYESSHYRIHREMVLGKKISLADVKTMVNRYDWSSGTVYAMYDDKDPLLLSNSAGFFVYTNSRHVYKCLDNGKRPGSNGSPSTVQPTGTPNTAFETGDGYKWKYMYTISAATDADFNITDYIAVEDNSNVVTTAIDGALENIIVTSNGVNYSAYNSGQIGTITNTTNFTVNFDTTTQAVIANGSFVGSSMLLEGDTAQTSIVNITAYNGTTKTVTIDSPVTDLANVTSITIAPRVTITGDGTGAVAFATINSANSANVVSDITMYDVGSGYSVANVVISCNSNFRVADAEARAIISPPGGHGANSAIELGAERIQIYKEFNADETSTLNVGMQFRQVCLLKDPLVRGVSSKYTGAKFNQLYEFDVAKIVPTTTSYSRGDLIFTSTANGIVAFANTSTVYVANVQGTFEFGQTLNPAALGGSTDASEPDGKYKINSSITNPILEKDSGQVLYYQNIIAVLRADDSNENFRLIIKV